MKIVISGGGMVGMAVAGLLRRRGFEPLVIERMRAGAYVPRGYMMGFQAFPTMQELGLFEELRAAGRDIAVREDGTPVAVTLAVGTVLGALARDLPVQYEHALVGLITDADGRVTGVEVQGPTGHRTIEADLVVACDGVTSPVRQMAGLTYEAKELDEAQLTFMTDAPSEISFKMVYFADGGHIGMLSWPQGTAGWRSIDKVGADRALAPGVEAIREMWLRFIPEAAGGLAALTSLDQVAYRQPRMMSTPKWWTPGVVIIGDAARFFGPETGVNSGLGLGDALALAEAIRQNPDDPDAACASYVTWREPAVRPYEATDPGLQRMAVATGEARPEERWPPDEG